MRLFKSESKRLYRLDRLPALIAGALAGSLALAACGGEKGASKGAATPPPRFAAVQSAARPDPLKWCDVHWLGSAAPKAELPPLVADQGAVPAIASGRWTWVNFWATWCGPCREEMPMLSRWDDQLDAAGSTIDLMFVSVDEDAAALDGFWKGHKDITADSTGRLPDLAQMPAWLEKYKLGLSTPIPIHMLVAPDGSARCVRAGSVTDADLRTVKEILAGG